MIAAFKVSKDEQVSVFINSIYFGTSCVNLEYWYQNGGSTNIVAINFINHQLGFDVSWGEWFLYASALVHSYVYSFIFHHMIKVMPPEINTIEGGEGFNKENCINLAPLAHVNGV